MPGRGTGGKAQVQIERDVGRGANEIGISATVAAALPSGPPSKSPL